MILQSGLRGINVGADTENYANMFESVQELSWSQIWENYATVYIDGIGKDPGYVVIEKLFQTISTNYQLFLCCIACLFFTAFGKVLYQTTNTLQEILLSVVAYQALFYGFFSVTGLRQTIAIAIMLLSYSSIVNRNILKYLIYCFIAVQIHKSALLFIPIYLFVYNKKPYTILEICVCLTPLMFIFGRSIAILMTSLSLTESYSQFALSTYETSGAQMFIVFMIVMTIMLFISRNHLESTIHTRIAITAFSFGLLLTPLTWIDPSIMRAVMYYSIFILFLIGNVCRALDSMGANQNSVMNIVMIAIFTSVVIKHDSYYSFFWQNNAF